ncbi:unnamed protein product [Pleuronectes platessa]|uniref:Uncharacterized protein n=1 Tax=Pleuronectes platessa TaxID=8262 RepID=A0A9N7UXI7_PLEPL|nr:unnamed protein product [Pleuronectes platessa]
MDEVELMTYTTAGQQDIPQPSFHYTGSGVTAQVPPPHLLVLPTLTFPWEPAKSGVTATGGFSCELRRHLVARRKRLPSEKLAVIISKSSAMFPPAEPIQPQTTKAKRLYRSNTFHRRCSQSLLNRPTSPAPNVGTLHAQLDYWVTGLYPTGYLTRKEPPRSLAVEILLA